VGSVSLEIAILAPALLVLVITIVQAGLWFHARNLAQSAAREGATAAASYTATTSAGLARARAFLSEQAGDSLSAATVSTAGSTATLVRVEVTGRALSVLPGVPGMTVTQTATAPSERFTVPSGGAP
jgi:Flp pilus assembly protein TadG